MAGAQLIKPGILLLENFIDSVHLLPADVSRHLGYIKSLDEQVEDLKDQSTTKLQQFVARYKGKPLPLPAEAEQERLEIDAVHAEIIHLSEEKKVWADQLYEMLINRVEELEDLKNKLQYDAVAHGGETHSGVHFGSMSLNIGGNQTMSGNLGDGLTSSLHGHHDAAPTGPSMGNGHSVVISLPTMRKQPSSALMSQRIGARRSPSESVHMAMGGQHMAPSGMPPAPAERGMPGQSAGYGHPMSYNMGYASGGLPSGAQPMPSGAMYSAGQLYGPGALDMGMNGPPAQAFQPMDPNMKSSSHKPQSSLGKLLQPHQISPGLVGKHAELLWPDDAQWYIIRIEHLDMLSKRANILYITGETENDVDLAEIAAKKEIRILPSP